MTDKTGGPAFPCPASEFEKSQASFPGSILSDHPGMTLRDYFAAKAMHAYLMCIPENRPDMKIFAKSAYEMADAMLKERDK